MKVFLWQALAVCFFILPASAFAQGKPEVAAGPKIVFQKLLPGEKSLVVLRREGQYVSPTQETLKQFSPGVVLNPPDHVYWYDFILHTKDQADKTLWSHQVNQFDSFEVLYGKFQIYDLAYDGTLAAAWLDEGVVYANVVGSDAQNRPQPMRWQDTQLQVDNATSGPIAVSAAIEGSLKQKTLAVIVTNVASADVLKKMGGTHIRYSLRNGKWVKTDPFPSKQLLPLDARKAVFQ